MQHSIHRQTRHRLDARLVGDVLAVRIHRVDGDIQLVGNLLAAQSPRHKHQHLRLALAQLVALLAAFRLRLAALTHQLRHSAAALADVEHRLEQRQHLRIYILIHQRHNRHIRPCLLQRHHLHPCGGVQQRGVQQQDVGLLPHQPLRHIHGHFPQRSLQHKLVAQQRLQPLADNVRGLHHQHLCQRFHPSLLFSGTVSGLGIPQSGSLLCSRQSHRSS